MGWLLPILGAAGAVGGLAWLLRPRNALVIYSDDPRDPSAERGEFIRNARIAARALGVTPVAVRSAAELVQAIRNAPSNLGIVVLIGHGTTTKFLSPARYGVRVTGGTALPRWISEEDFAHVLAPKLARGAIVSFAGCSSARGPREPYQWILSSTSWHGGADSLAGRLRDALTRAGMRSGEVRGHTLRGTTLDNPQGRTFYAGWRGLGQPGIHIMAQSGKPVPESFTDYRAWNTLAQGPIAVAWMLGRDVPRLVG